MIAGIRRSASAMRPVLTAHDVIANNLANVGTIGFRADRLAFHLGPRQGGPTGPDLVVALDSRTGAYQTTGEALDLAISGEGYFVVETPEGERYLRSGHFVVASDGTVATLQGHRLMGDGGPISVPSGVVPTIDADGTVRDGSKTFGRLRVVSFPAGSGLLHAGSGLLASSSEPVAAEGARVLQGVLEEANIQPVQALVEMIQLMRHFEMNQKALQVQDETLGKLINWLEA